MKAEVSHPAYLMNRIVDGLGVRAGDAYYAQSSRRLAGIGYVGLKDLL